MYLEGVEVSPERRTEVEIERSLDNIGMLLITCPVKSNYIL
jgi:hypothetical protein